jgi:hypothetical protein
MLPERARLNKIGFVWHPAGPAACGSCGEFSFRLHRSGDTSILAARAVAWLRPATRRSYECARAGHDRLSNLGLSREAMVLCAVSAELMVRRERNRRWRAGNGRDRELGYLTNQFAKAQMIKR